jgi:heme-degrading monooxygenase HmoA
VIARVWKGVVRAGHADEYLSHLQRNVIPELGGIAGFRGVEVLRGEAADPEVIVITRWDSMDAIRRFAGPDPAVAVVAPEAKRVLASYDSHVRHFAVVL